MQGTTRMRYARLLAVVAAAALGTVGAVLVFSSSSSPASTWLSTFSEAPSDDGPGQPLQPLQPLLDPARLHLLPASVTRRPCAFSLATMVQDKSTFVVEWVIFHRLQGAERFLVADDRSDDYDGLERVLAPYIAAGIVELVPLLSILPSRLRAEDPRLFDRVFPYADESYARAPMFFFHKCELALGRTLKNATSIKANEVCQRAMMLHVYALARMRNDSWSGFWDVDEFIFVDRESNRTLAHELDAAPASVTSVTVAPLVFGPVDLSSTRLDGVRPNISQPTPDGQIDLAIERAWASVRVEHDLQRRPFVVQPRWPPDMPQRFFEACIVRLGTHTKGVCRPQSIDFDKANLHRCVTSAGKDMTLRGYLPSARIKFYHHKYVSLPMGLAKAADRERMHRPTCYGFLSMPIVQQYLTMQPNSTAAAAYGDLVRACAQRALDPTHALADDVACTRRRVP